MNVRAMFRIRAAHFAACELCLAEHYRRIIVSAHPRARKAGAS